MPRDSQESIDDAAVAWFVLLRDDAATDADGAAFAAWLGADPRHRAAWAEVEALWAGLDAVMPALAKPGQVVDLPRRIDRIAAPHAVSRRSFWGGAAAAGLALAVGGSTWIAASRGAFADYRTGTGEQRSVTLPDGSSVVLGAASALSVDFAPQRRSVMLERGEGYFSVAPDPDRPFAITAGAGIATALDDDGIVFEARLAGGGASFAVAAGHIAVRDSIGNEIALAAGEQVGVTGRGLDAVMAIDLADIGAWRAGRIVFRDAPLGAVIDDLQRYLPAHIFVIDSALDDITVTGVFDGARADAALDTIAQTLPIRLRRLGDLLVLVSRAG